MMKKWCTISSSMQFVFDDILLKILIIVSSCSLKDLFLANMVSKKFKEIAEEPRIYQHINITDFETSQTSSIATSSAATSRPSTCWGCNTSSETIRKKPELSGLRVQSPKTIK
ncbi:hypothetical protein D8674_000031 [Pyrus ussuriensis x Pyrus communis]|uniref:F-box protein n=1 Tax=Pyrus ussuriensis x Pyrus communis TaxID=2448454 RepID=A0A5N5F4S0_9ROSA|nr:hypothetical protein D8674_000031 [Pyrus ussuriensis x Pyrus communis]